MFHWYTLDMLIIYQRNANYHCYITVTSQWDQWRLKSLASQWFAQPFIQVQIKENIKVPRHWPLWVGSTGDQWIPVTNWRVGNAGNCSIWWRHHVSFWDVLYWMLCIIYTHNTIHRCHFPATFTQLGKSMYLISKNIKTMSVSWLTFHRGVQLTVSHYCFM